MKRGGRVSAGLWWLAAVALIAGFAWGAETPPPIDPTTDKSLRSFFGTYCQECHGPDKQKGERRFDQLALPVANADTLHDLQDIIDQLNLGEMPPAKAVRRPGPDEVRDAVQRLTRLVADGHARLSSTGGRTVLRRLNRREYINTVGDLFGLNMTMFDPTTKFPRDQMVMHLDNVGDALKTSGYLLAQYLDAADQVVEKAFELSERPPEQTWTFTKDFLQQQELNRCLAVCYNNRFIALFESPVSIRNEGSYGPLLDFADGVPADGFYEIKVKAEAKNRKNPYAPDFFGTDPVMPFRMGLVAGNSKAGPLHRTQPIEPHLGEVVLKDEEPEWFTFRVWLNKGWSPRFTFPNGMLDVRNAEGRLHREYNAMFPEEERSAKGVIAIRIAIMNYGYMPQIRIHEVGIRGPLLERWPTSGGELVLGGKPFAPERTRRILQDFANRAYRRPARPDEVDRLMAVVETRRKEGQDAFAALKDGLKAALCSPAFLYLLEPESKASDTRTLTPHALAARLSYFLWSSMPDAELRQLADNGALIQPEVLVAQTRRLLASPRADAFIAGFLDGWLNLRSFGDMPPDRAAFLRFYAENLQPAMRRETDLFTRDLLDRNDSIVRFLDADYAFVNRPLARLYGMEGAVEPATGHLFRRVALPNKQRGGLLGQGSILTVSANGIETSPVIRGVWVLENILGTPPAAPPDNVPPIDPDIRGAKSMREILSKHRESPSCMECHRKIDPLGFALENFDPIGGWRTRYEKGAEIDPSGELPNGQHFDDVTGLKRVLVERKEQFARMLTERLLSYACGRRLEALDRPAVDRIVAATKAENFPFRSLMEQVVLSSMFHSK